MPTNIKKGIATLAVTVLFVLYSVAQCTSCTVTVTSNTPVTVSTGQSVCINFTGTFDQDITFTGSGSVCIASTIDWSGGSVLTTSGSFCSIDINGTASTGLSLTPGMVIHNYGSYTGNITINGGAFNNMTGGNFSPSLLSITGGIFSNFTGGNATISNTLTIPYGASINNDGNIFFTQAVTIDSGSTVSLGGSSQSFQDMVTLNGLLRSNGLIGFGQTLNIHSTAALFLANGDITIMHDLNNNNGTINLNGKLNIAGIYTGQNKATIIAASNSCNIVQAGVWNISPTSTLDGNQLTLLVGNNPPTTALIHGATSINNIALPNAQPTNLSLTADGGEITANFTPPTNLTGINGYIALRNVGANTINDVPTPNVNYHLGDTVGSSVVAAIVTNSNPNQQTFYDHVSLSACQTNIQYAIFSYGNIGNINGCIFYNTTSQPLTASITTSPAYTWNSTVAARYGIATNWLPARTTPQACDVIRFNKNTTALVTDVTNDTLSNIIIADQTNVQFTAPGNSITLTLTGNSGNNTALYIDGASSLTLGANVILSHSMAGLTDSINGTIIVQNIDGFRNTPTTAISTVNQPNIVLGKNSTVEYNATNATQTISNGNDYANLIFLGYSTKVFDGDVAVCKGVTINNSIVTTGSFSLTETSPATLTMTDGALVLSKQGIVLPELTGVYSITGGTLLLDGSDSNHAQILRSGVSYHHVTINAAQPNYTTGNVIQQNGTISINATAGLNINQPAVYAIDSTSTITGGGAFHLNGNAGLIYSSAEGITGSSCGNSGSCGNIRTATRSFASQATYILAGHNMNTGDGLPTHVDQLILRLASATQVAQLTHNLTVDNILIMSNGVLKTTTTKLLTIAPKAVAKGASDDSYIDGPVQHTGTSAFTFPTGAAQTYRPISIAALTGDTTAINSYTAMYVAHSPDIDSYSTKALDTTLTTVKNTEYWLVNRTSGNSQAQVELLWNAKSGILSTDTNIRVAGWKGTQWQSLGGQTSTGHSPTNGSVTSTDAISTLTALSFGSYQTPAMVQTHAANQVLSFSAILDSNTIVDMAWGTNSEYGVTDFVVQRSTDSIHFTNLQHQIPVGNSNSPISYTLKDALPLSGISYYRVVELDSMNNAMYSNIVEINNVVTTTGVADIPTLNAIGVKIYPTVLHSNEFHVDVNRIAHEDFTTAVQSMEGQLLSTDQLHTDGTGQVSATLHLPVGIASGMYIVSVKGLRTDYQAKLIYTGSR